jgi:hypothetical protein
LTYVGGDIFCAVVKWSIVAMAVAATAAYMRCGSAPRNAQSSMSTNDATVQLAQLLLDTTLLRQASTYAVHDTLHIVLPGTRPYEIKDASGRTRIYEKTPLDFRVEKVELTAPEESGKHKGQAPVR